jgi:hypothetical protein
MSFYVITANRLRDGATVWLGQGGTWESFLQDAKLFQADMVDAGLAVGAAAVAGRQVVGVYKVEVSVTGGVPSPLSVREMIRAAGPSVRTDLGVQSLRQEG